MDFGHFIEWAFYGIVGSCAVAGVAILSKLSHQIAVLLEKVAWHEKWLERHDDEIQEVRQVHNY